jgi:hypothetical protein
MTSAHPFARFSGTLALIAAPLSWLSLVIGLLAVGWDFDTFGDPLRLLNVGAVAATQIQWSYWLSSFGSYLLLLPLLIWLHHRLTEREPLFARWYALCGLGYLLLGGTGAAILASVWPFLIRVSQASPVAPAELALLLQFSTELAEGGLQGLIQNIAGGVWWIGLGQHFWTAKRLFSLLNFVIGGALLLTALGGVLAIEALSSLGLVATLLVVPIWSVWAGVMALQSGIR